MTTVNSFFAGCKNAPLAIKRRECRYLRLDISRFAKRKLATILPLQVKQISGLSLPGIAWKISGEQALIWYWDESPYCNQQIGYQPEIEPLYRPIVKEDAIQYLALNEGFELNSYQQGKLMHSRWLPNAADENSIWQFIRDAGHNPANTKLPNLSKVSYSNKKARDWKIHTNLANSISWQYWLITLALFLVFAALLHGFIYGEKLSAHLEQRRELLTQISKTQAKSIAINEQIARASKTVDALEKIIPDQSQLILLQRFAQSQLLHENLYLREWNYTPGQLRLGFAIKSGTVKEPFTFKLTEFIAQLERLGIFSSVELNNDSGGNALVIQTKLFPLSQMRDSTVKVIARKPVEPNPSDSKDKSNQAAVTSKIKTINTTNPPQAAVKK